MNISQITLIRKEFYSTHSTFYIVMIRSLTTEPDLKVYDAWVKSHPEGNLWQSLQWKHYQETLGREVRIYATGSGERLAASALVVIDKTTGGYSTWEIPRGPLTSGERETESGEPTKNLMTRIVTDAKHEKCMSLMLSPSKALPAPCYPLSARHVHPESTRIIDLTQSEEEILAQMHPKGRYNIKVADKEGVTVRRGSHEDIDAFYELLQSTGNRDGFKISRKSHYASFMKSMDGSFILLAEHEKKPIAGLIGVMWPPSAEATGGKNRIGIYYYGASSYAHRSLMAPYQLQWEAMKLCKAAACTQYDLLGVSTEPAPKDDPWIGISDFKRKFGGTVVSFPPEQMVVLRPVMKWALEMKRKILG